MRYPVVRSLWLAGALALYCVAGAIALLAWVLLGAGSQLVWIAASGALWLACSLLAAPVWAFAQPLVAPVPWVASAPQTPHDIISGRATRIKVAEIPAAFGGGEADLKMSQDILGLAYAYQY